MIFDASLTLSGAVSAANGALTGQSVNGAGNVLSTNTIDVGPLALGGNQNTDLGSGESLQLAVRVMSAPTVGTTVQFQLIQADDAALTAGVQVLSQSDAIPIASLTAGAQVLVPVPRPAPYPTKRYMGARYVNVGAIATASYFAGLVLDAQSPSTTFRTGYGIV